MDVGTKTGIYNIKRHDLRETTDVLTVEQKEFREELWGGLVNHIRIDEKSNTEVFQGGIDITI